MDTYGTETTRRDVAISSERGPQLTEPGQSTWRQVKWSVRDFGDLQDEATERANSCISLETFIRLNLIQPLEKDLKARSERLKRRQKSIHELLSKLENSEKIYMRVVTDLETFQRKHTYLKQRHALDLSEEIEKIEIDLKKCASALSVKGAECVVAHTRMVDIQQKWRTEWDSFSNLASTVDLQRRAQIRKVSMELLQAEMLVKEAALARDQALYVRLEGINLLAEDFGSTMSGPVRVLDLRGHANAGFNNEKHIAKLSHACPAALDDIANSLWPKTNVTQQQLATLTAPVPPAKNTDLRSEASRLSKTAGAGSSSRRPSAPRTYSEDSFSTPRLDSPIIQILTTEEMDQVSPRFPSEDSVASLGDSDTCKSDSIPVPLPKTFKKPRKPSKPLPGLPCDQPAMEAAVDEPGSPALESPGVGVVPLCQALPDIETNLPLEKPPSLPSFSNLRLGSLGWDEMMD